MVADVVSCVVRKVVDGVVVVGFAVVVVIASVVIGCLVGVVVVAIGSIVVGRLIGVVVDDVVRVVVGLVAVVVTVVVLLVKAVEDIVVGLGLLVFWRLLARHCSNSFARWLYTSFSMTRLSPYTF